MCNDVYNNTNNRPMYSFNKCIFILLYVCTIKGDNGKSICVLELDKAVGDVCSGGSSTLECFQQKYALVLEMF